MRSGWPSKCKGRCSASWGWREDESDDFREELNSIRNEAAEDAASGGLVPPDIIDLDSSTHATS